MSNRREMREGIGSGRGRGGGGGSTVGTKFRVACGQQPRAEEALGGGVWLRARGSKRGERRRGEAQDGCRANQGRMRVVGHLRCRGLMSGGEGR